MELIDTHCHLDFEVFDDDRKQIIETSLQVGLVGMIIPATHQQTWQQLLSICKNEAILYPALGLHPMFLQYHGESHLSELEKFVDRLAAQQRGPVAIGEIGLDYRNTEADLNQQHFYFEQQLLIAREKQLPVILHILKAHDEALSLLKKIPVCGGTVHAFNGSLQQAEQYMALGFKLGFGGMLTYERSSKLRKLAAKLPLESIVLETDAPDMTVVQHQYERNSPIYLPYCFKALVEIRKESPEKVAVQTTENAMAVFNLNKI